MATSLNTIKNWFKTNLKPTQAQFWAWMDSFWHKDETIPQNKIENLQQSFDAKLDVEAYQQQGVTNIIGGPGINVIPFSGEFQGLFMISALSQNILDEADFVYQNINELIANQNEQQELYFLLVLDPSEDPAIPSEESGARTYQLTTNPVTGNLSDYTLQELPTASIGNTPPVLKTGNTVVFTEDAIYNQASPLAVLDINIDLTDAVNETFVTFYTDRHIADIIGAEFKYLGSGRQSLSKLNKIILYYNNGLEVFVTGTDYLPTANILIIPSAGRLDFSFGVLGATSYIAKYNTTNDENTALDVPNYDGVSTSAFLENLTNGQDYYLFITPSNGNKGLLDGATAVASGMPSAPNTILGGMGISYPTAASLATFLGINETDITNFNVGAGNDISCDISANYSLPANAFQNNTDITNSIDTAGNCTDFGGANAYRGCSNIIKMHMAGNFTSIPYVWDCPLIEEIILPNNTQGVYARNCDSLKFIYSPLATSIPDYAFNSSNIELSLYLPLVTSVGGFSFDSMPSKLILDLEAVTSITGTRTFYSSSHADNKWIFPSVTTFGASQICRFFGGTIVIPSVSTNIGGTDADSNTFLNIANTATIYAHANLQTNNAGGIDGDLAYAISRGATVIFNINPVTPPSVTDLAFANVTANSADLTFITPATQNTFSHLDVYIDTGEGAGYRLLDELTNSGGTIANLPSGKDIKIKVKTIDQYYNRSAFSNEVTFTTL